MHITFFAFFRYSQPTKKISRQIRINLKKVLTGLAVTQGWQYYRNLTMKCKDDVTDVAMVPF